MSHIAFRAWAQTWTQPTGPSSTRSSTTRGCRSTRSPSASTCPPPPLQPASAAWKRPGSSRAITPASAPPPAAGLPLTAFLQLHCHPSRCLLKTSAAENFPEIVEIHRLSGSSCTMVKVRTASMAHLSSLLERIGEHADASSHIVLETPLEHQALKIPPPPPAPTRHPGWNP